jgi:hypothetical protein
MWLIVIAVVAACIVIALCGIGLVRNNWIFQQRRIILDQIHEDYRKRVAANFSTFSAAPFDVLEFYEKRLAEYFTYDEMMSIRTWLIWDVEKLRNPAPKEWPETIDA